MRKNLHLVFLVICALVKLASVMEVKDCVASADVPVAVLQRRIQAAASPAEKEKMERELNELMQTREVIRESVVQVIQKSTDSEEQALRVQSAKTEEITDPRMYREVLEYYKVKCFNWHEPKYEYALHLLHLLANLCQEQTSLERIKTAIDDVCENLKKEGAS